MRANWTLLLLVTLSLVAGLYLVTGTPASSSGNLTTSEDTQAGQVRVRADGDVIYLTSETVPGETVVESEEPVEGSTLSAEPTSTFGLLDDLDGRFINLQPPRYPGNFGQVFRAVLNFILVIAVLLVFGYIVMAAIQWITSGGDRGKTDRARQMIISAVVGLIIIVSSYAVINVIVRFIGFSSVDEVFTLVRPINTYSVATESATTDITVMPDVRQE